ncbi:hypothetical protein, partial [Enterobacter intestinihominis]
GYWMTDLSQDREKDKINPVVFFFSGRGFFFFFLSSMFFGVFFWAGFGGPPTTGWYNIRWVKLLGGAL